MGNCLVHEEKVVKVMKTDGKTLEYKAPIKVHQVLSDFSGHALSDSLPEICHLHQDVKLLGGNLYYLVPLPLPSPKVAKKKVRFSDQQKEGDGQETGIVRIKLVISKQELQELLHKSGVSAKDMVSQLQGKQITTNDVDTILGGDKSKGWKPALESIPEID